MSWAKVRIICGSTADSADAVQWKFRASFRLSRKILLNNCSSAGTLLYPENTEIPKRLPLLKKGREQCRKYSEGAIRTILRTDEVPLTFLGTSVVFLEDLTRSFRGIS